MAIDRSAARHLQHVRTIVVDGALGRWTHDECRVPRLAGLVEYMWLFDGALSCRRERTFPTGLFELIVHLGDRYGVVEGEGVSICPEACLTGLQFRPLVVEAPTRRTGVLGIVLTPAGAHALCGRVMPDVTGCTVDLEDLCGAAARELAGTCQDADRPQGCFEAAAAWLEWRLRPAVLMAPAVRWAVSEIRRHHGAIPIGALQTRTGHSRSRFIEMFHAHVGTTPKQYARIVRFRHLLDRLPTLQGSLADAAHDAGYYDQPHMNAEFKEISGFTPTAFLAARRYPNSASIAEDSRAGVRE